MILAKNIHKHYGNLEVLRGVDIEIQKGEIVSIVGKSGAGKTTLLQILGTLDTPNAGELHIDGVDVIQLKGKQLSTFRNERVGFIFQFHHLLPEFNAVENVMMPALIGKKSEAASKKRAVELLDYLGLSHRLTHKPGELSGGEQQRVAVARALINSPSVIFADEPTGNLDSALSTDLHQLLFNLRRDFNQTFVIVTHSEELARLSDRRLVMQDGRIIE